MNPFSQTRFRTVVLDVDSTLCTIEGIDWLAALRDTGIATKIEEATNRAMQGEVALEAVYGSRLTLVNPTKGEVDQLAEAYISSIAPGAREAIAEWRAADVQVVLVSGGIRNAILPVADALDISRASVHAVDLKFDTAGAYVDFDRASPLTTAMGKRDVLLSIRARQPILAVGDGRTDLAMRDTANAFAAFTGVVARSSVTDHADYVVSSFADLTRIILERN